MPRMKGGQAVVAALINEGVEVIFGIPGVHTLEIYDALYDRPQVRHIVTRHEQGAAFMADGYARASGKVGVVLAITGPGVTNASTGLGQAYADGSPLLIISSEVDSRHKGRGNLHELKDQQGMLSAITLWSARAESLSEIPLLIHQAMERAWSGWPGPVHVGIPIDVLAAEGEVELMEAARPASRLAKPEDVARAVKLLKGAERPVIFAGWGVTVAQANPELVQLAERLQAPVLTSPVGKGVVPEDHPLSLGTAWRQEGMIARIAEQADLGLVVGSRLSAMETRNWTLPLPKRLIYIAPESGNVNRGYPPEVGLVGDPKAVLRQVLERLGPISRVSRAAEVAAAKAEVAQRLKARSPEMRRLISDLRTALDRRAILSMDLTIPSYWASAYFPVYEPRTFLNPYNFMALGFGLPAGIGAKIACPDRPVVVICGDGGFMFTAQELATAVKYGLDLTVVLFNNDGYGAIRRHQQRRYDGRVIAADIVNPDFVKFAQAFGAKGVRLSSPGELRVALQQALQARGLWLIEVPSHSLEAPW